MNAISRGVEQAKRLVAPAYVHNASTRLQQDSRSQITTLSDLTERGDRLVAWELVYPTAKLVDRNVQGAGNRTARVFFGSADVQ